MKLNQYGKLSILNSVKRVSPTTESPKPGPWLHWKSHLTTTVPYFSTPKAFDPPKISPSLRTALAWMRGDGVLQDFDKGVALLKQTAANGERYAQYHLARAISFGAGIQKDDGEACKRVKPLADAGLMHAQNSLGYCYEEKKDYDQAFEWYSKAAAQGYSYSIGNISTFYEYEKGVKQSYKKAYEYSLKAAKLGHNSAMNHLAKLYDKGLGVPQSTTKALTWYLKAAESSGRKSSQTRAMLTLGSRYETGLIAEKSLKKAEHWYRKAAEMGNANAQFKLGSLIRQQGIESPESAMYWFQKAADQGTAAGLFAVGLLHELGDGVEKDLPKALEYYQKVVYSKLPKNTELMQEATQRLKNRAAKSELPVD